MSPEYHAREWVGVVGFYLVVGYLALKKLSPTVPRKIAKPPTLFRWMSLFGFCAQWALRFQYSYPFKWAYMCMPCNMMWTIAFALSYLPLSNTFRHFLGQSWFCFQGFVWLVFLSADTDDIQVAWEWWWFWISHM